MSSIHFIGGEKGGIGKSVVARLISQYCLDNNHIYAGMDADQSHGTLSRFYPEFTTSVNLDEYESADRIVEAALESDISVVVDLPAQSERFLNRWMDDNDVAELCDESDVHCVYWYVVDDGVDSAQLAAAFLRRHGHRLPCVLVKNFGRGQDFSSLDDTLQKAGVQADMIAELPGMHPATMRKVDKLNLNFWAAANLKEQSQGALSLMERRRVKVWARKAYEQLGTMVDIVASIE